MIINHDDYSIFITKYLIHIRRNPSPAGYYVVDIQNSTF